MNHDYIERNQIVDLYLMGRLEPGEARRFEEHYLGCADCLDGLEVAEIFQGGLKQVATEEVVKCLAAQRPALLTWLARVSGSRWMGLVAVVLMLLGVLLAGGFCQREQSSSSELAARAGRALRLPDSPHSLE